MGLNHGSKRIKRVVWICLFLAIMIGLAGCDTPAAGYTGTPYKVLVVMMELNKKPACPQPEDCLPNMNADLQAAIDMPRHTAEEYITLLTERINKYYQNATYGQVYFQFELLESKNRNGWWNSPYTLSEINKQNIGFKQIAMNIAYTELGDAIYNYDRVLFISNVQYRGGQACCLNSPAPYYAWAWNWPAVNLNGFIDIPPVGQAYKGIPMIIAEVAEGSSDQELITVASHELGHMIGAPDQYYGGSPGMGMWDIMHADPYMFHFGAWTKLDRNWINWNDNTTRMPCNYGSCEIITVLDPQEKKGNNALLIPTDPLAGVAAQATGFWGGIIPQGANMETGNFVGLMAECRKRINGDEAIPEEGVLVTFSNPYLNISLAGTASEVQTNEAYPYSLLQPGESYFNSQYNIRITNMSNPNDLNCTVKATRSQPSAPDLYITQGSTTPGDGFDQHTSIDIWNDAEINGWEKYVSSEQLYQVITQFGNKIDVPLKFGDPIFVSDAKSNTGWALFHNGGDAVANNFNVNMYLRQPISVSVQTENCGAPADSDWLGFLSITMPQLIGTLPVDHLDPGQSIAMYIGYQASSNAPLEIGVEIEPAAGEVVLNNNVAYETYTKFFYETMIDDALTLNLSDQCKVGLPFLAGEVPGVDGSTCENWDLVVEPSSGFIQPGETVNFSVSAIPHEGAIVGDSCLSHIAVMMPINDVYIPVESFAFEALVTEPSTLTCEMRSGSNGLSVAGQLGPDQAETIALVYTDPNGERIFKNLETLDNGTYFDELTSALPGDWTAQAMWAGDNTHAPTESTVCSLKVEETVVKEPVLFRVDSPAYCRQGPSTYYGSLGITTQDGEYPITGISVNSDWYYLQFSDTRRCWVRADSGQTSGDLSGVEVLVVDIITPTPTLSPNY
jgi:hypothetical protein